MFDISNKTQATWHLLTTKVPHVTKCVAAVWHLLEAELYFTYQGLRKSTIKDLRIVWSLKKFKIENIRHKPYYATNSGLWRDQLQRKIVTWFWPQTQSLVVGESPWDTFRGRAMAAVQFAPHATDFTNSWSNASTLFGSTQLSSVPSPSWPNSFEPVEAFDQTHIISCIWKIQKLYLPWGSIYTIQKKQK